jgi:predicted nucleotidyltransferase
MPADIRPKIADLPSNVQRVLIDFVAAAEAAFGDNFKSAVLFGSAAEGRLRPTSDVNLIVVLGAFDRAQADRLREPLRVAHAAVKLEPMFVLQSEIAPAAEAFAVKFADVLRRRRLLTGADPFAGLTVARSAEISQLRQVTLNLALRSREQYLLRSLRPEQAAAMLAESAGPLRSCAAAVLELEGKPAGSAKEALERIAAELGGAFAELPARMTDARIHQTPATAAAAEALFTAGETAVKLHERAMRLH